MIIRKMTASFGVLQNRTIELQPGLNIIEAPNEYGKSTWCAFLRAMLYGVDTSQRARAGVKPDKVRYAPWSGAPMGGTMELTCGGKSITLTRATRTPNAPMRSFSAVYTGTNRPVSGLTAENVGEMLTGVTLPVFERTAFIDSSGLGVEHSTELEKKITSLVTSGEESSSFTEASERLRALQRKCRFRGTGMLPRAEEEILQTQKRIDAMEATARALADAEERADAEREKCVSHAREAERLQRQSRASAEAELAKCTAELEAKRERAEQCAQAVSETEEKLRQGMLAGAAADEAAYERIRNDVRFARQAERTAQSRAPVAWIWILCIVLAGGMAVAAQFRSIFWAGTAVFLLAAAALGAISLLTVRRRNSALCSLTQILNRYGAESVPDISAGFAEYRTLWEKKEMQEAEEDELRSSVRTLSEKELLLRRKYADALSTNRDRLSDCITEEQTLREEAARLRGKLETLGDPLVEKSRLGELKREHERVERELDALTIALDELAQADEEMQSEFSPRLSRTASAILRKLTGGAYSSMALDSRFNASVQPTGEIIPREGAYLSSGTADQVYLALRLSLCDLMLGGDEPCPMILDDALINFDEERMGYALDYLGEIAEYRQIILFTCHEREKAYISGKRA